MTFYAVVRVPFAHPDDAQRAVETLAEQIRETYSMLEYGIEDVPYREAQERAVAFKGGIFQPYASMEKELKKVDQLDSLLLNVFLNEIHDPERRERWFDKKRAILEGTFDETEGE